MAIKRQKDIKRISLFGEKEESHESATEDEIDTNQSNDKYLL